MRNWQIGALLIMTVWFAGCVPYPHTYQRLPEISGIITNQGSPIGGAQIFLGEISDEGAFSPLSKPVSSSKDGSFSIEGKRRLRLYIIAAPADHFERWALRIDSPNQPSFIYSRRNLRPGPVSAPEFVRLRCEISLQNVCEVIEEKLGKW